MNPFEMVIGIVLIGTIGSIVRSAILAKHGLKDGRRGRGLRMSGPLTILDGDEQSAADSAETLRLREEVKELKERLKVLERITVEKESSLSREIENLRDR